jgi:hypothetical protein
VFYVYRLTDLAGPFSVGDLSRCVSWASIRIGKYRDFLNPFLILAIVARSVSHARIGR